MPKCPNQGIWVNNQGAMLHTTQFYACNHKNEAGLLVLGEIVFRTESAERVFLKENCKVREASLKTLSWTFRITKLEPWSEAWNLLALTPAFHTSRVLCSFALKVLTAHPTHVAAVFLFFFLSLYLGGAEIPWDSEIQLRMKGTGTLGSITASS